MDAVRKKEPVKAAISAYQAVSPGITTQTPLEKTRRGLIEQAADSLAKERAWTGR